MKRLLIVVNVDWFFLSHRLPVALAARDADLEVHIATTLTGPAEEIERYGFILHPLKFDRRSIGLMDALKLTCSLYALMRKLAPDVVHLVTIQPVLLGGLAARIARIPKVIAAISGLGFVFTARGTIACIRRTLVALLYRLVLSRPNVRVIFQNRDDQALLQRHAAISDEQVVRIRGSGVDVKHWAVKPLPPGPPVIMMAARLLVDKGILEFIEAARALHGHSGARFVIVGDIDRGNPTSLSREQIEQWATEGIIDWWGYRNDMPTVLASAHIVVLPSYREGFPKVLIEAAAAGRAVITTDVPGCRDAIETGRTGMLVQPRDAQALTRAIRDLIDDPVRCRTMGESGRLLAEHAFDIQLVIDKHLALYQQ